MDALTYERLIAAREAEIAGLVEHLQEARATIARLEHRVAELETVVADLADEVASGQPVVKHWATHDAHPTA